MFDDALAPQNDSAAKYSQDENIMNSWEKVTELPESKRAESPTDVLGVTGLPFGVIRSPLDMVGLPLDVNKPQLAALNLVASSIDMSSVIKPQLAALNLGVSSAVLGMLKPQLAALNMEASSAMFGILKPQLAALNIIAPSAAFAVLKPQLDTLSMGVPSLNAFNALVSSWTGLTDSIALLSGNLTEISRNFGSLQYWMPNNFKHLAEKVRVAVLLAFQKAGLCLAPSMSEDLIYQIAQYAEIGDLRTVTLLVWNYYARNDHAYLRQAVNGWYNNAAFATRQRFLMLH